MGYIIRNYTRYYSLFDFPDYYISKFGNIWSEKCHRLLKKVFNNRGYQQITLCKNGEQYTKHVHRLLLETFIGSCPDEMEACHNNGNPSDNRLKNLRWDTHSNNLKDAQKHGTLHDYRGENHPQTKLNNWQVRIIRRLLGFGILEQKKIANIFHVTPSNIFAIKKGRSWTHLL